jgi:hypothetical protein
MQHQQQLSWLRNVRQQCQKTFTSVCRYHVTWSLRWQSLIHIRITTLLLQVDDCHTVLSSSKAYYQRHRVCAAHLAAMSAKVDGVDSRFCQQCGKFQPLTEFDQDKR